MFSKTMICSDITAVRDTSPPGGPGEDPLTDILIRGLSDDAVATIEANARRVGLSRAEYIRRVLERERHISTNEVTVESLARFCETFADLGDVDVMRAAWS